MVTAIRDAESSLGSGVKRVTEAETEMYQLGRRSLVAAQRIEVGETVLAESLGIKRPGFGIKLGHREAVIGRKARRVIEEDEILTWDAFM